MTETEVDALLEERSLLRTAVDGVSALLAYWDSGLICRFANRAYEQWFRASPGALLGRHVSEFLGPLYELNLQHLNAALRGQPQTFDREFPDPAGGPSRYVLANYVPDASSGIVRGIIVLVTDVTRAKRFEIALKESEAKFSGIIAISADAIVSVEGDQRITIFNEGAERIFGYRREEIIGAPLEVLLPVRLRARHREHVARFAADETQARPMGKRDMVLIGLRKNGTEFPAEAAISRLEVSGRPLLTVALRDITERKRVEVEREVLLEAGAVLASSLRYTETLKSIARLVVRRAADLCLVDIIEEGAERVEHVTAAHADPSKASACEKLEALSLDRRHILARTAIETKEPRLFAHVEANFLTAIAQNDEHRRLLEELAPRSAIIAPLISTSGVLGALVLGSSTPGRYEARDLGFVGELARNAALAIENARLYEAARHATRARDDMLSIVAHDIRNPLSSIQLAATLLQDQLAADGSTHGIKGAQTIQRSVARANRLIQDLLDTTRIDAGAFSVSLGSVPAKQVVTDAVAAQRLLASSASVELTLDLRGDIPDIWADRDRILQLFENLVGNAVKFTPKGARIIVGATRAAGDVLFWVADTGAGIPAENLPHLFDRFWQAKRADRSGAGLGLAISKGIVEAHGGRIWVESASGRGTTFYFTVPSVSHA